MLSEVINNEIGVAVDTGMVRRGVSLYRISPLQDFASEFLLPDVLKICLRRFNKTRKAHKLWDKGRRCAGNSFSRQCESTEYFGAFAIL